MALHPDDPPFPVLGLPRIAGTESDLDRLFAAVPSVANGLTFCTGSLGAHPQNDLARLVDKYADRIHFFHLRSVQREADGSFFEDDHLAGSTSLVDVMREAIKVCDRRSLSIPMRPDHGHVLDGDANAANAYPGYSYVGRLRGLAELRGLELGLRSNTSADL
jgi:mannonate dehydratase